MIVFANLDRTYQDRKNSDFMSFFRSLKSEKLRFFKSVFSLFFCFYCLILIKLKNWGSSSKNRTGLININTGKNRKNSDSLMLEHQGIAPKVRRHPAAITQGAYFRTARLIAFNPRETRLLLYSGHATSQIPERSEGDTARRKKLKTSLPLIRFLRSLDALFVLPRRAVQTSPNTSALRARAVRGIDLIPKEVFK